LFFSHPSSSRLNDTKPSIALSRRINKPDGSFGGVAAFRIRLDSLQRLFDRLDIKAGAVMIVLNDGTVLAKKPYSDADVGSSIAHLAVFPQIAASSSGSVIGTGILRKERLFTYSHIRSPAASLITIVAPTIDDVLADWRRDLLVTESVAVAFGVALGLGLWLLAFRLRDKLRAEDELARLAATDPLTKLSNRRALELRLKQEWQRARR